MPANSQAAGGVVFIVYAFGGSYADSDRSRGGPCDGLAKDQVDPLVLYRSEGLPDPVVIIHYCSF